MRNSILLILSAVFDLLFFALDVAFVVLDLLQEILHVLLNFQRLFRERQAEFLDGSFEISELSV
jgi:hypothetical protein